MKSLIKKNNLSRTFITLNLIIKTVLLFMIVDLTSLASVYAQNISPSGSTKQSLIKVLDTLEKQPIKTDDLLYEKDCANTLLNKCSNLAYEEAKELAIENAVDKFIDSLTKDSIKKLKLTKSNIRQYLTGTMIVPPKFWDDDWAGDSFKLKIRAVIEIKVSDELKQKIIKAEESGVEPPQQTPDEQNKLFAIKKYNEIIELLQTAKWRKVSTILSENLETLTVYLERGQQEDVDNLIEFFKYIDDGDELTRRERIDEAIRKYDEAIKKANRLPSKIKVRYFAEEKKKELLKKKPDSPPRGKISRIKKSYTQGDTVYYTVEAKDDKSVRKMTFKVKNKSSAKKIWKAKGKSVSYKSSFSTDGWKPGKYYYSLLIEDNADNSKEYTGKFVLAKKAKKQITDTTPPTGTMTGIRSRYTAGDTIDYTLDANDDNSLRKMSFKVDNSYVKESWDISGQHINRASFFSTRGWRPGTYAYSFLIEDNAGNTKRYRGSFALTAPKSVDTVRPTGNIIGIERSYKKGDVVHYTVQGKDNKSLRRMTFKVNNIKEPWDVSGKSATRMSFFSTSGWKPGTHSYSLLVEDMAGNSEKYQGKFVLKGKGKAKHSVTRPTEQRTEIRKTSRDVTRPTGGISKIRRSYEEGDTVYYTVQGKDNKSLKKMTFAVKNSSVKKSWDVSGSSATHKSSFSTKRWRPGTYHYSLSLADKANNSQEYKGSFVITERQLLPLDLLKKLKQRFSGNYNKYVELKDREKRGENVDRHLIAVVKNIIEDLRAMDATYKKFPPTPQIKEGIRTTRSALKTKERELRELTQ
ncbi:hypothetical protein [Desulfonema magnum]|nr:hypothetical protein [Desulfonema magnum]